VGDLGLGMGLCYAAPYITRRSSMAVIENITLIVALLLLGVGATWAVLVGLIYFLEIQND